LTARLVGRCRFERVSRSERERSILSAFNTHVMANICETWLSISRDDAFTTDEVEALRKDIEEDVTYDGSTSFERADDCLIECMTGTRWAIPTKELQAVAAKYRVNIRGIGREDGCGFVQVVCVNDRGEVVQDASIDYAL